MNKPRYALILALLAMLVAAMLLAACGSSDGGGETPPAAETAEPDGEATPTPEGATPEAAASPTGATTLPEIGSLCDLVTPEEVEEALGQSVTDTTEVGTSACRYSITALDTVQIEQGTQQIFEEGLYGEYAASGREPVPGIGDGAAWFGEVAPFFLAVRQGDVYFQIRLNLSEVDSETQLEIAKGLAAKAVERLP